MVLEALLNLFARMLPTANDTASGRARRNAFIANVFLSASEHTAAGEGIAKILEDVPTSDWEQTAIKLFQALADYNGALYVLCSCLDQELIPTISPQPFETKEVIACQKGYPSDRIFLDDKGFFANVVLEVY